MKKLLTVSLFLFVAMSGWGKQTEADFYADDFFNQSVLLVEAGKEVKSCQAVRISPSWYLTAAHCVTSCKNKCTLMVQLLQGPLEVNVRLKHSADKASRRVFIPAEYKPNSLRGVRSDIALVRFNPSAEDYLYVDTRAGERLDYDSFIQRLKAPSLHHEFEQWQVLKNSRPVLRTVSSLEARHVIVPLAVPVLEKPEISFLKSETADFYYFPQFRFYTGSNFGVEQGLSGSGVIAPGGDIVGIVSASAQETADLEYYNEKDELVKKVPFSKEKFYFTPINNSNKRFIQNTIRSFSERNGEPRFEKLGTKLSEPTEVSPDAVL